MNLSPVHGNPVCADQGNALKQLAIGIVGAWFAISSAHAQTCTANLAPLITTTWPSAVRNDAGYTLPGKVAEQIDLGLAACKVWPAHPEWTLVALPVRASDWDADLVLFVTDNRSGASVQRLREARLLRVTLQRITDIQFDTARYQLNGDMPIFGVRITNTLQTGVGEISETGMSLYAIDGKRLRKILDDLSVKVHSVETDPPAPSGDKGGAACTPHVSDVTRVIGIGTTRTHDFADLVLHDTGSIQRGADLLDGTCGDATPTTVDQTRRLKYDGTRYPIPQDWQRMVNIDGPAARR